VLVDRLVLSRAVDVRDIRNGRSNGRIELQGLDGSIARRFSSGEQTRGVDPSILRLLGRELKLDTVLLFVVQISSDLLDLGERNVGTDLRVFGENDSFTYLFFSSNQEHGDGFNQTNAASTGAV